MPGFRSMVLGLLFMTVLGCGGGSGPGNPSAGFTIASGNWTIPIATFPRDGAPSVFAGGLLTQNGSAITGVLHVTGSPCFDPVADQFVASGSVSSDFRSPNALTLTTQPVRGQVLNVSATWDSSHAPTLLPPTSPGNPVSTLVGTVTLSGGACAGSSSPPILITNFDGPWAGPIGNQVWSGHLQTTMSQTGPDAQGFSHLTGTLSITGSPCFASGTIVATTFAGQVSQLTVNMDTGQVSGTLTRVVDLPNMVDDAVFNFTVHGGPCDGQTVSAFTGSIG